MQVIQGALNHEAREANVGCVSYNIHGFDVTVCTEANGGFSVEGSFAGLPLHKAQITNSYVNELGHIETDNKFIEFSMKVQIRVLEKDRNDGSILSKAGDVIYCFYYWDAKAHLDCVVPLTGNLGSHCWNNIDGSATWKHLGHLNI
jgi:hypothetical protein